MPTTDEGLQRRLTSRQLTMIAIGSAIGVGLFRGSTVTIRLAGPASSSPTRSARSSRS
jgi:amino acid transporter, AAT family